MFIPDPHPDPDPKVNKRIYVMGDFDYAGQHGKLTARTCVVYR